MIFLGPMDAIRSLCGFTDALERLLASADAVAFERAWCEGDLDQVGWEALALGRRRAPHHRGRHAGAPAPSVLRLPRSRRAPSARGVAAVRALPHDAGRASCVRRGSGGGGPLLPGPGGPAGRAVPADSGGRNAAALPRAEDTRVPVRALRSAPPAAIRAAARHGAHRPRSRAL